MRTKKINYLETNKFHRLFFEKEDVIEVYEYILNDFKEEAKNLTESNKYRAKRTNLDIEFSNTEDSKKFYLDLETYLEDNNKITELSNRISNYIDREDFCEINISYEKLYSDNSIVITIKNNDLGVYPYAEFCIKSNNDEWINSKIAGLNSIFKKTLKIDYFILRSLLIYLIIYLALCYLILVTNLIDSMRSLLSLRDNFYIFIFIISLTLGHVFGMFAKLLSKFISIKCFPRVEFSFGKKGKYYEGNRKLFYWALATIITCVIIPELLF